MKTIKNLLLITVLFALVSCQGPYNKPPKKPLKIGLRAKVLKANAAAEKAAQPEQKSMVDVATLDNKGVGPIKSVEISEEINSEMVAAGKETFNTLCIACHKMDSRFVGPALGHVVELRSPEWIMNMILDPAQMLAEDEVAKALLEEFKAPMVDLGLTKEQAREILEYMRSYNKNN